ncbi:MAG: tetratricopeptide repeat protein [Gemmatimonadetes bacterium]|jgi:tetratricopeptide (TPR) repeat protein|nr:tetratricopeptide repeat protein [Gemmatimonadota bacterium]MBT6146380.1 tetratricopeptide repeat protein [Gemmatimonadota bacterium]MBT7861851.1 tetratricopeptide repeat protein [Gemmatimonadota bacterium]
MHFPRPSRLTLLIPILSGWLLACTADPEPPPLSPEVARGEQLLAASRYPEAIAFFQREIRKAPSVAPLHAWLGHAYTGNEQLLEAVGAYKRCLEIAADDGPTRVELATLLTRLDRLAEAEAQLHIAISHDPQLAKAHRILGRLHFREARYDLAIESYTRATTADPTFVKVWGDMGEAQLRLGDLDAAEAAYRQGIARDSTAAEFRDGLGFVLFKRRDFAAAAVELEQALQLDPLHARAHFNLANTYLRLGRSEDGKKLLERFGQLDDQEQRMYGLEVTILQSPERATLYHDLAVIHSQRGETDKARRRYIQAVLRDSNFAPAYHNLGNIQLRQGRLREAMGLFRRALRADSTYVLAYRSLGNSYMRQRQVAAAIESFEAGLRHRPGDEDLTHRINLAREFMAEGAAR